MLCINTSQSVYMLLFMLALILHLCVQAVNIMTMFATFLLPYKNADTDNLTTTKITKPFFFIGQRVPFSLQKR